MTSISAKFAARVRAERTAVGASTEVTDMLPPQPKGAPTQISRSTTANTAKPIQHDRKVASQIVASIDAKLNTTTYVAQPQRAASVRAMVADAIDPGRQVNPEARAKLAVQQHIIGKLRAGVFFLNTGKQYNSDEGIARKRFLYQMLADPTLGNADPMALLIAKELGINLDTFDRFAQERKTHGLGWQPQRETQDTLTQEYRPVCLLCLVGFLFVGA